MFPVRKKQAKPKRAVVFVKYKEKPMGFS